MESLDNLCVWYHSECQKAQLPNLKNDKCNGYNHPTCFAYLSVKALEELSIKEIKDLRNKAKTTNYLEVKLENDKTEKDGDKK